MKPLPEIRRLSTGAIDIDFYRRQGVAERTACMTALLGRLLPTKGSLIGIFNHRRAAGGDPLLHAPHSQAPGLALGPRR